ncbi:NAD(P)/FAD-dependent oxidoreductase [Halobacillus shinanisalinarum]|uniref:Ferredoxin--NADP reductase n=1 Tax=Halobacillus shinanisalinarum TaxID=2932258 RepID=A0ABY4GVI3_9BACI|nr:NAD(P)/FAD-dependent oxidoreductase [Halobacillus shinanisalinarum]UOQ91981.1 NAD(P)/FAD-dependent oxidoreductase [Halobacillus shinanisalinarum]
MQQEQHIHDTIIIGGGPAGLFSAFYGGMRGMDIHLIESLPELGGQLTALYPEKYIYDVAGFPKVKAKTLVQQLEEQALAFDPHVSLDTSVSHVEKLDEQLFQVTTTSGVYFSKTVIITGGVGAFQPQRLPIDNAVDYEGSHLYYSVSDIEAFRNKKVLISGGGDSAVDWALTLESVAEEVTLVHRRDKFRAHEQSVEQLQASSINLLTPYVIHSLSGKDGELKQVTISDKKNTEEKTLDIDSLIVSHGFKSNLGPIQDWGIELQKKSIVVNPKMETNIKGIYAAGDITTHEGKVNLIASGFGEGPIAINYAKSYIDPKSRVQPMHSTSLF